MKNNILVRYSYKGPGHGRKSFTIYSDVKQSDGKRVCETIKDDRLSAINMAYKTGVSSINECRVQVKEIIKELYKQDPRCRQARYVHNAENWKMFEDFWEKVYSYITLLNVDSTKIELRNAVDALGELSIYSASRDDIQKCIDERYKGNAQRRIVTRMNQLLRFVGRERVKLRKNQKEYLKVSYLNEADFNKVLFLAETEIEKTLLRLCYYCGLRVGEAYALESHMLLPNGTLRVTGQIDRHGKLRHTKTKRPRLAYIFPQGIDAFRHWTSAAPQEKDTINRLEVSRDLMKKYCKMAFPNDPEKHLTFHALRHCYAINLLSKGVSLTLVAQSLGNTLSVCQEHYAGFELSSESIEAINAIIGRKS